MSEFLPIINCSLSNIIPPDANFFLTNIDTVYLVFLTIGTASALITNILGIVNWYYAWNYISCERIQSTIYWLIFLYPLASISCIIGMYLPRTLSFTYAAALAYVMICLYKVVDLMRLLFGGRTVMVEYLIENNMNISLQVSPFCCCCRCLPKITPTFKNLRRIEWMVMQTPIVRIALQLFILIIVIETRRSDSTLLQILDAFIVISMLLAIYGSHILANLASTRLAAYRFSTLFRLVDITQSLYGAQKPIFDLFAKYNVFECGPLLANYTKSMYWMSFFLLIEMLLLTLISMYLLNPTKNAIFDKYPNRQTNLSIEDTNIDSKYDNKGPLEAINDKPNTFQLTSL